MLKFIQIHTKHSPFLNHFIHDLYTQSFPREERRDFPKLIELIEKEKDFMLFLIENEKKESIGFISLWNISRDIAYGEHFAILPEYRNNGYGAEVLQFIHQRYTKQTFIFEVEEISEQNPWAKRRIDFYLRYGFHILPYPYKQAPYHLGDSPLQMHIMSNCKNISPEEFQKIVDQLRKKVYQINTNQEFV